MNRRHFLQSVAGGLATLPFAASAQAAETPKVIRIGYQKSGVLIIARQRKAFEERFRPLGIELKWAEFSAGPPLLEALNTGNVDYGTTGDSPPIFAQAARADLVYAAAAPSGGSNAAILVRDNASIHSLADLRGKKVGFTKASSAHNVTIVALEKAGLTYADITPVYLQPADAAAAFTRGAIDAWTIWDPYFAIAEAQPGTRILASARDIFRQNSYFLANRAFTQKYPLTVGAINDVLAQVCAWTSDHRDEAAALFADAMGIDLSIMQTAVRRSDYVVAPMNERVIAEQQSIADRFHKLNLIPDAITVRDIVWNWVPNA